jgi:hypothetical protein
MIRAWHWFCLAVSLAVLMGSGSQQCLAGDPPPIKGLLHNEDETQFFYFRTIPKGKAGETIDRYVDVMADAGVKLFLCNTNARRTNYRSRVWDAYWDGYDPAGPDDQPFLAPIARSTAWNGVAPWRKLMDNALQTYREGVDYPARVLARCRHDGMSPWITLRMNDCHCNDVLDHPFHGSFWRKNPQFRRQNCTGYFANCLDYARPEVRNFYKALVVETLDRYDIDGLELDFMREPYLFSAGKEAEGAPILTAWVGEVRKLVDAAAVRRGHLIRLGVRVPSRPETALGMGLDAITWAKTGLIDLLVVTPRWATIEFEMPIEQWRKLLKPTKTRLAGGLEIIYRPWSGAAVTTSTPELSRGAATNVLARGADAVYLFNYFQDANWPAANYRTTLRAMGSLDSLLKLPRTVGITYRDVTAPNETYREPFPAIGKEVEFALRPGPLPNRGWQCEVLAGMVPSAGSPAPAVSVNGHACQLRSDTVKDGLRLLTAAVPADALAADVQQIKLASKDQNSLNMQRLEFSFRPPAAAK